MKEGLQTSLAAYWSRKTNPEWVYHQPFHSKADILKRYKSNIQELDPAGIKESLYWLKRAGSCLKARVSNLLMFWVQIKNKSPAFPACEFQPHSSTGGECQGFDKKEFLNDLSELSWGDWHHCELWTELQRVFYRRTPEGRSLDGSFNAHPHMQSRWSSLSDEAQILLPLKVLPLNVAEQVYFS